jgi:hypothetical protein
MFTEGGRWIFNVAQGWRGTYKWFDLLVVSLIVGWSLPLLFTYLFYRRYVIDGRAEPALVRIWFGGMTVAFLAIGYSQIVSGNAEALINSLKDDPFSATALFIGAIVGLLHSIGRALLTGDGAERRRRRTRPASSVEKPDEAK